MPEIFFHVDGDPKAQPRPRAGVRKIFDRTGAPKFVVRAFDAGTAEGWKALIAEAVRPHLPSDPIAVPVTAQLAFYIARPDRLRRKKDPDGRFAHPCKPDAENCAKAVLDILTQCRLWADDSLVWRLLISKQWTEKHGGRPGMDCWISWEDDVDQPALLPPKRKTEPQPEQMF